MSRRLRVLPLALLAFGSLTGAAHAASPPPDGEVIVKFAGSASPADRVDALQGVDAAVQDDAGRTALVDVPGSTADAVRELNKDPDVLWAEPNVVVKGDWTPNDADWWHQWAFHNFGQYSGFAGVDMKMEQAWDVERGTSAVVLGVVDTGADVTVPDLANSTFKVNTGETAGNGVDDDGNGFIDDTSGWDFINNDNNPTDDNNHGTATTGTAAGKANDGVGTAGVAGNSTLIEGKALGANGSGSSYAVAQALDYVADRGAKVVNASLGGGFSQAEADAINSHPDVLYVVAAGNSAQNNDNPSTAHFPCALPSANVVCVGASDSQDRKASFTSYGKTTVDLMAPGVAIAAPVSSAGGQTQMWNGTSFSSPLTAGVAALLLSHRGSATPAQLKRALMDGGDVVPAFGTLSASGRRLNALGALRVLDYGGTYTPPPTVKQIPVASGIARVNEQLTMTNGSWKGSGTASFAWQRCDTSGNSCSTVATARTYRLVGADAGHTMRAVVTMSKGGGGNSASSWPTAVVAAAPPAPSVAVAPGLIGIAQVGQQLTAIAGVWNDLTGVYLDKLRYQWQRCESDGTTCSNIGSLGTSSKYKPGTADTDKRVRVVVVASTASGTTSVPTGATSALIGAPKAASGAFTKPEISGVLAAGRTLTVTAGRWTGSAASIAYQWQRCNARGQACGPIGGATGSTYVVGGGDASSRLRVAVTASNAAGYAVAYSSITPALPGSSGSLGTPEATPPAPQVGVAFASPAAVPAGAIVSWLRCDAGGETCVPIFGATGDSYLPTMADLGKTLRVEITAPGGAPARSAATPAVAPAASTSLARAFFALGSGTAW